MTQRRVAILLKKICGICGTVSVNVRTFPLWFRSHLDSLLLWYGNLSDCFAHQTHWYDKGGGSSYFPRVLNGGESTHLVRYGMIHEAADLSET